MIEEQSPAGKIRRSETPDEASRLAAEAAWLEALAGPGVATVSAIRRHSDGTVELVAAVPDGPTLSEATMSVERWVAVATALAATVRRLHAGGIHIGGIDPDRVVVPLFGSPMLADLSTAGPLALGSSSSDVASLAGALLESLNRCTGDDQGRRRLLTAARVKPPSADELLKNLRRGRTRAASVHGRLAITASALAAIAIVAGLGLVGSGETRPGRSPITTAPRPTSTLQPAPTVRGPHPDPLLHDGRPFAVDEGDLAVTGDWFCDGDETPAVLRPSTGEIAVFELWPAPGGAVAGRVVARVPGATTLRVTRADSCDELSVDGPGFQEEVRL